MRFRSETSGSIIKAARATASSHWKQLRIGAEYLYWRTDYVGGGKGTANRVDLHLTMPF